MPGRVQPSFCRYETVAHQIGIGRLAVDSCLWSDGQGPPEIAWRGLAFFLLLAPRKEMGESVVPYGELKEEARRRHSREGKGGQLDCRATLHCVQHPRADWLSRCKSGPSAPSEPGPRTGQRVPMRVEGAPVSFDRGSLIMLWRWGMWTGWDGQDGHRCASGA